MVRILIWKKECWEGRGSNTGDLAIANAMVDSLKKTIPDVEITIFSRDPEYIQKTYNVFAASLRPFSVLRNLLKTDLLVLGGGTILTDKSSIPLIIANLSIGILAIVLGKQVMCYAIGVGELSWFGKFMLRLFVNRFALITVRDKESKNILELVRVYHPPIYVTADAAFALMPAKTQDAIQILLNEGVPVNDKPLICICPRRIFHYSHSLLPFAIRAKLNILPQGYYSKMEEFKKLLAQFADYLVKKYDAHIVFLPMFSGKGPNKKHHIMFASQDEITATQIRDLVEYKANTSVVVGSYPPKLIMAIIGQMDLVIGIPLHSLILAAAMNVPMIGFHYLPKVERFMKMIGQDEFTIHVDHISRPLSLTELIQKAEVALANRMRIKVELKQKSQIFQNKERINAEFCHILARHKKWEALT